MARRYLALGDSYTIGEGVAAAERWPAQLATQLRAEGVEVGDPQVIATTGWTTGELSAAMDEIAFDPPYALVTLLIGVNNQYRGLALDAYRAEFCALLQRAVAYASGVAARVVVVSIPDWGVTPFAAHSGRDVAQVAREIDAFNATAQAEVAAAGARWVDVAVISRAPAMRGEFVADGLHPSAAQYLRWVDAILPAARAALAPG